MKKETAKKQTITFLGKTYTIGSGIVPPSPDSPKETDLKKVLKHLKKFIELGGYDENTPIATNNGTIQGA